MSFYIQAQAADYEECFCTGVSALVTSLHSVAPMVCTSSGSRGGRMYSSWAAAAGVAAKPMIIDTDMVIIVQENVRV